MPNTEFRFAALQTPPPGANSRQLMGVVMRYNTPGRGPAGRPEIFEPGAFGAISELDISLNFMHKRERMLARTGGSGLELVDSGSMLSMTASLPQTREADDTLELVRTKNLRGLSVEFLAQQERMTNGTRIIAKARLLGIGVVDTGAHDTTLEASGRRIEPVWGSVSVACCHTASRATARVSVACAAKSSSIRARMLTPWCEIG